MKNFCYFFVVCCCAICIAEPTDDIRQLLFSIRSGVNVSPLQEWLHGRSQYYGSRLDAIPDVYRSSMLDDFNSRLKLFKSLNLIVVAMLKSEQIVASATFNISDRRNQVDLVNWFAPDRLVDTKPFWIGKGPFIDFGVEGFQWPSDKQHRGDWATITRTFYIHKGHRTCQTDSGLMGVIEEGKEYCDWSDKAPGQPPIFYYAKNDASYESSLDFADQLIVYLK
ncbi:hypothetical protein BOX15_Mlig024555g1 [Macrostomum lignano]|uniref:Uncharacterized protein n=1 Tax=Macrostomum lignano TaxID=282301 RepID=A0A267F260_9PLAT|nr:hypothetical protein BOX15_Mlig024555g1 [Macrostomum lignano]